MQKNVILEKNNDVILFFFFQVRITFTKNIFFITFTLLRILLHYTYQLLETCNIYVTFFCMYTCTHARTYARTHAPMHTASDSNYVNIIYFKYFIIIVHIRNSVISIKFFTSIKFIQKMYSESSYLIYFIFKNMKLKQKSVFYSDFFSIKFYNFNNEIFEISNIYIIRVICYMYSWVCMRA